MSLTEADCIACLPIIETWEPALRARFVEGVAKLAGCSCPEPDLAVLIGMVLICCPDHASEVRILRKREAAIEALANGVHEDTIAAILSPAMPGYLDVFVFARDKELVFAMPVADHSFELIGTRH